MKVAAVGSGNVGKEVFKDLQHISMIHEITLVGRNKEKLRAEVRSGQHEPFLAEIQDTAPVYKSLY